MNAMTIPTAPLISASMIYDLVTCEHRLSLDLHGQSGDRDALSPFVAMLWKNGVAHETEVMATLAGPLVDLRRIPIALRREATPSAMADGEPLILGAILALEPGP